MPLTNQEIEDKKNRAMELLSDPGNVENHVAHRELATIGFDLLANVLQNLSDIAHHLGELAAMEKRDRGLD